MIPIIHRHPLQVVECRPLTGDVETDHDATNLVHSPFMSAPRQEIMLLVDGPINVEALLTSTARPGDVKLQVMSIGNPSRIGILSL